MQAWYGSRIPWRLGQGEALAVSGYTHDELLGRSALVEPISHGVVRVQVWNTITRVNRKWRDVAGLALPGGVIVVRHHAEPLEVLRQ